MKRRGDAGDADPAARAPRPPALPELTESEVLRHYLRLSQQTLGMMGISLFGTCTMKYNPRVNELDRGAPEIAEMHPLPGPEDTLQGLLEVVYGFDMLLRELSGMDQFVFQAGGGADAAYTHACITRAYHAARGELAQRDEIITTIQAHPCNPATAATAGFKVITLPLEENGYPSLEALRAAVSERTAALMVNNPDDMGIYNPEIKRVGRDGARRRRAVLLRPRELQRRHEQDARRRARLRRLHVHAAQDVRRAEGRRRPRGRRLRLQRRADRRTCPARWSRATASASRLDRGLPQTASAGCASSWATCRRS